MALALIENQNNMYIEAILRNVPEIGGLKFAEIPVGMLTIPDTYQRAAHGHEKKIASKWDKRKAGALTVSYRGGQLNVIDGQHRLLAAKMVGEQSMPCQIYENLSENEEAIIFGNQDENKIKLRTVEKLRALIVGGDRTATILRTICDEYGIVLIPQDSKESAPVLTGLRVTLSTLSNYGESSIRWIFDTIRKSGWHLVPGAYSESNINSLRNIYVAHKNELNRVQERIVSVYKEIDYDTAKAKAVCRYPYRTKTAALTEMLELVLNEN